MAAVLLGIPTIQASKPVSRRRPRDTARFAVNPDQWAQVRSTQFD